MPTNPIGWTEQTWNPVTGCTAVSEACENCYARRMATRLRGRYGYPADEPFRVTLHRDRLSKPYHWRKPRRVFVCSMGDLFHKDVPFDFIELVWQHMCGCGWHIFLILTKRPERLAEFIAWRGNGVVSNIHLGVTVENESHTDRIRTLLDTPAAVRFVSFEPGLGPLEIEAFLGLCTCSQPLCEDGSRAHEWCCATKAERLDWIICGGENGPGARPMNPDWARSLRDQCVAAGVPFYFKGMGAGDKIKKLDGKTWNQFPEVTHG